jgi:hypothetical protein
VGVVMAIIKVPARSIVGRPKLNIANDNKYKQISYTNSTTSFEYKSFYKKQLDILSINESTIDNQGNKEYPLWSSIFGQDVDRYILKTNNIDKTLNVYEWNNGAYPTKVIPISGGGWYNYAVKFTIPKDNLDFDYTKTTFGYIINQKFTQCMLMENTVTGEKVSKIGLTSSLSGDYGELLVIEIPETLIYDKSRTDAEMFSIIGLDSSFTEVSGTAGGISPKLAIRISDTTIDVFLTNGVIAGNTTLDSVSMLYPTQTIEFFYKDIIKTQGSQVNNGAKYSLADNELLSTETTVGGKTIYEAIEQSIVSEYGKGKFSVDLSCLYMEYKDTSGNIVYTGSDGQMVKVGDIIEPYYFSSESGDLPVATYPDGSPMAFKVYKSEISTTDSKYITNDISALEVVK